MITLQGGEGSWYHQLKIMTCESVTYLPMNNVTITNVKEIRFWTSYLPTFLHDVMKYPIFFFGRRPLASKKAKKPNFMIRKLVPPTTKML